MKVLFFSDVHGSPEHVRQLMKQDEILKPDQLVLLGDVLYHGPRNPLLPDYAPPEVVELLNRWKSRIVAVRGNCDSEVDQMLLEFPIMADYSSLLLGRHRFFLTHGHLWNPQQQPPLGMGDILGYGHTHIPHLEANEGMIYFNPGSISLPKGGSEPSFGFYEEGELSLRSLKTGESYRKLRLK